MKQSLFTSMLCAFVMAAFFTSCGGNSSEKKADADTTAASADTTAKTLSPTAAVNTVLTEPQNMVVITHKVADFAKWKAAYDAHDSVRLAAGLHNYVIGRGVADSNVVLIALKSDDAAKAKAFGKDPGLKTAMKKGGVIGSPTIYMITATWRDTAIITTHVRALTTFTVKDWDAWVKGFDAGRQERLDNGLADRIVSHEVDDKNKGHLVIAMTDTAKANAYYKSDALKKRRADSGVVGTPALPFVFNIVQRY